MYHRLSSPSGWLLRWTLSRGLSSTQFVSRGSPALRSELELVRMEAAMGDAVLLADSLQSAVVVGHLSS